MGYLLGEQQEHERQGADAACTFLSGHDVSAELIGSIGSCILATRLPQRPTGPLEQIVRGVDLYHFGAPDLLTRDRLMRKEGELRTGL